MDDNCWHENSDEYLEICTDCQMTFGEMHDDICVSQADWYVTIGGLCSKCGCTPDVSKTALKESSNDSGGVALEWY